MPANNQSVVFRRAPVPSGIVSGYSAPMRRLTVFAVVGLAAAGCRPDFATLEEACGEKVPGQGRFLDGAAEVAAVGRINCYRRLAGFSQHRVDDAFSRASAAHARYLAINGYAGLESDGAEMSSMEGFTGEYVFTRLVAQGYDETFDDANGATVDGFHFWTLQVPVVDDPLDEVDLWMDHWVSRQVVLHSSVVDSGFGRAGDFSVFENYSEFPMQDRATNPVIYPKDGQTGVPVGIIDGFGLTYILPADGVVGYPITIHFGSGNEASDVSLGNPFGAVLLDHLLLDESGSLVSTIEIQPETAQVDPDIGSVPFPYTIAIVPEEPLEPSHTYQVFARVSWNDGIKDIQTTFTTSAEDMDLEEAARRSAPFAQARFHREMMVRGPAE